MPKIVAIETIPFCLPMTGSLRWGPASQLDQLEHVLLRLITDSGQVGLAEAPPRPTIYGETVESIQAIIQHHLAPLLLGLEIDQVAEVNRRLAAIANNQTAKGAIDIALHDAQAQAAGKSLADWLGIRQTKIKVSYILGIADLPAMLAEAKSVYDRGVRVFKVKVGRDFGHDLALLAALQTEFQGADVSFYADANMCFSPENAVERLTQLANQGLLYIEEPLPIHLLPARANLRQAELMPLIADDSTFSESDLARELAFDTFDILNIKTARTGYFSSRQMLKMALAQGKGVMVGSQASSTLGTIRAAIFAGLAGIDYPCELSFFLKLRAEIINRPLTIDNGYIDLTEAAAISLDQQLLERAMRRSRYLPPN